MTDVLARIPVGTSEGRHNIFSVQAIIKIIMVRAKPTNSDHLFS